MKIRRTIGDALRRLADRIDYEGAFRAMGYTFTYEKGEGIRLREGIGFRNGKQHGGCMLWYRGPDYDRAYDHADNPPPQIDWSTLTVKQR